MAPFFESTLKTIRAPGLPLTRPAAIAQLGSAADASALFESANRLLFADRSAWGDAPAQSDEAARLWRSCAVALAARPKVTFLAPHHRCMVTLLGSALEAASLAAAKALAQELLSPLRHCEDLAQATSRALWRIQSLARQLASKSRERKIPLGLLGPDAALGPCSLVGQLCGKALSIAHSPAAALTLPRLAAEPMPEPAAHATLGAGAPNEFENLLLVGGFTVVSAGPAGGIEQARAHALVLAQDCAALADAVGLPGVPCVGLGRWRIEINSTDSTGHGAYCMHGAETLSLGSDKGVLAHEWTHALDFSARLSRAKDLDKARSALLDATRGASDPSVLAQFRATVCENLHHDRREEGKNLVHALTARFYRRNRVSLTKAKALAKPLASAIMRALDDPKGATDERIAQLCAPLYGARLWPQGFYDMERAPAADRKARFGPTQALEMIGALRDSLAALRARRDALDGLEAFSGSAFIACAHYYDLAHPTAIVDYWTGDHELIARMGEAFFVDHAGGRLSQHGGYSLGQADGVDAHSSDYAVPRGAELAALLRAFQAWIDALRPMILREARQAGFYAQPRTKPHAAIT